MAKKRKSEKRFDVAVVYGDVHDPFVDEPVFEMFLDALSIIKPNLVIELGDGYDFFQLSHFLNDPSRRNALVSDRDTFIKRRMAVADAVGKKAVRHYLPGNHEARLHKYLWSHAPELNGLDELTWDGFLRLEAMGWTVSDFRGAQNPTLNLGKLMVTHGHIVRKHSGYSARAILEDYGCSILAGHTHRLGSYWRSTIDTTQVAYENGCLCSLDAGTHYSHGAINWQQGFSIVTVDRETDWFRVHQIPIVKVPGRMKKRMMLNEGILECNI